VHRALVQLLDKPLFRPQLIVEVAGERRRPGRRHNRRDGPGGKRGWREVEFPFDGELGQFPALVEVVPLALYAHLLQVRVVAVAAQSWNNLLNHRLVPLERLILLADRVQIFDPIELKLRLNAVSFSYHFSATVTGTTTRYVSLFFFQNATLFLRLENMRIT